jgi:hypothetical protein
MLCGEPVALSTTVTSGVSAPSAPGGKCPWIVQLAPAARLVPQLFANKNEDAPVPVTLMLVIDIVELALLVKAILCDPLVVPTQWLSNDKLVADGDGGGRRPVPLSEILCGEPPALSVMVIAAVSVAATSGAK